ncbi:MAG TPA: ABC transporter substrate-binding protein [Candidatus Fournierella excrementigallinarum]|nr:ABC transporter substrate-binding protein [Candidatus Fournierella excrementigallinarum]
MGCAGCAAAPASGSASASVPASAPASEPAGEAEGLALTDQAGRTVELAAPAKTVVSGYYISTYAVLALGKADAIAGLEKKADTRPLYQMAAPALIEKPGVGTMKEMDVEAVAALGPDLVILPAALTDYADTLASLSIPALVVAPESHEALVEMIGVLGRALGAGDAAAALTGYYDEQLERMASLTTGAEKPAVYMASNSSYLSCAPAGMYQNYLIETAGGVNAAASLEGDYWTEVSYEDVLAMAPEVIVVPSGAEYTAADVLADAQLAGVPAVENGKVYQMPAGLEEWDSPIPSGILGCLWLTSVLHPEEYPFEEFVADAAGFYQAFYGFAVDESLITK